MRLSRIYFSGPLNSGDDITLTDTLFNYVVRVLRLKPGTALILFNGNGGEFKATLTEVNKKNALVTLGKHHDKECESPLRIILGQCISRGEKMDYTIQKAVELGVSEIVPLFSERCGVKLNQERLDKRLKHWQGVIISACEQSGRNHIPLLHEAITLSDWQQQLNASIKLVLAPSANNSLTTLQKPEQDAALLIGPEGGLSDAEINSSIEHGFVGIRLGPRILRTETAGLAALSIIQQQWGDLN